jgi:pimeloyl-ACP methyl ester carboxylesterase
MPSTRLADRVELAYGDEGARRGCPLLLLAPLGRDRSIWGLVVPRLAPDRRCVTFDYRGTGQTPAVGPYTVAQFAADAAAVMDALDADEFDVVGSSMGAAVAQELAATHPQRVRRLVLSTPWARTDENLRLCFSMLRSIAEHDTAEALEYAVEWLVFSPDFLNRDPAELAQTVQTIVAAPGFPTREANIGHIDACLGHDVLDRLGAVRAPTLIIAGEADRLTPPRYAHEVSDAIPNASLTTLHGPDTSHGLALERLDDFVDLISQFLAAADG